MRKVHHLRIVRRPVYASLFIEKLSARKLTPYFLLSLFFSTLQYLYNYILNGYIYL